jgi:hypothetical protein
MAIFEITPNGFKKIEETSFSEEGIRERADLQRLLRSDVEVVSPDTMVISEEFGDWQDSRRRIDLLGIDKEANLVVIELKRSEDGGQMELQAIRYAAMVSTMTFERAVEVYSEYLSRIGSDLDSLSSILEFLEWDEADEDAFAPNVRLILVSADFSEELTSSVMWLNEQGLDISCVRIKPYNYSNCILADVQEVIPLPETRDWIKGKQKQKQASRTINRDLTKYDITIGGQTHQRLPKRTAIYTVVKYLCDSGISPEMIADSVHWRKNTMFRCSDGTLNNPGFLQRMKQEEKEGGKRFEERRFYCTDDELIHALGKTYAFTNQWGNDTVNAIKNIIQAFPDHPITIKKSEEEI